MLGEKLVYYLEIMGGDSWLIKLSIAGRETMLCLI